MTANHSNFCPLDDEQKQVSSIATTPADISDTLAYRELVNYAPVCIHEIGLDGTLKKMNRAGLDMMGLQEESQVVGVSYTSFVGDNNKKWVHELLQNAISGQPIPNFEFIINTDSGERSFWSNFIPMLGEEGQVVKIMGVTRETTEEYLAKKEIQLLNEQLEHRINQATSALQQKVDELNQTQSHLVESKKMAALGCLVAGVAHEINTPLGIGITAVSTLQASTKDILDQLNSGELSRRQLIKYLDGVQSIESLIGANLDRAAGLVGSFKQIAVDQTEHSVRCYKIKHYLDTVLGSWRHKLAKTNFEVHFDTRKDFEVCGAPGAIGEILSILINNTLTHGFENQNQGEINIGVEQQNEFVYLTYADTGVGINEELLNKIYEPFFTTKRGQGSIGLGLHVLYNCVTQSLKGCVNCNSKQGAGSEFIIRFPCKFE